MTILRLVLISISSIIVISCVGQLRAQNEGTGNKSNVASAKKQSLAQFVYDTIDQDGISAGLEVLEKYKDSEKFYLDEAELLKTGHTLYQRGKVEEAIPVFEAIDEVFPYMKKSLGQTLFLILLDKGAKAGSIWLERNHDSTNYYIKKSEIELTESTLYKRGKIPEAKVLGELFVKEFPESGEAHERMGEIYLAEDNKELALQKYRDCLAVDSKNNFFKLATQPPTTYIPTVLPRDPTKLFEAKGDLKSKIAFVFVQGGPDPALGVYRKDPLELLPNKNNIMRVHVLQSQILNRNLLGSKPVLTEEQSLYEHGQSAEILDRTVAYLKDKGKTVFVIGHSYGCMIGIEYLYSKNNLADKLVLMGSDFDEDIRNFPDSIRGTGKLVRWIDGVMPYEKPFFGDFPLLPLVRNDLNRIFANTDLLVSSHAKRRFTTLLEGKDLSNVIFAHGKFDDSNGRTKPHELKFLKSHGAATVEVYGDHHSMLSSVFMTNLYDHLIDGKPLKKSVASMLSDTIEAEDIPNAFQRYRQYKDSDLYHDIVEQEINKLGYQLLSANKTAEAVAVFELNVNSFPESWNVYDSLAESNLTAGNREIAVKNYEKSLEIHPGNVSGISAINMIVAKDSEKTDTSISGLTSGVDKTVRLLMNDNHVPGVAVVIVKDGKTIFKRGYGVANVEKGTTVDPDKTLFRIGSISKALTLLTLTRQIDQGRVKLDDDVSEYFNGIRNPHGFNRPVTVENLLTHTSGFDQIGIGRHVRGFGQTLAQRKTNRPGITEFLMSNNLRRVTASGQYFRYDTYGSTLAGAVIERVTGMAYAQAMKKEMFERLGMYSTFVEADTKRFGDLATGYGFVDGSYIPQPYEIYVTTPASSIDSTPADMGRLLEALTGGGANKNGTLFSSEAAKAVLAPQFRPHPDFPGVTHGLFESKSRSGKFANAVRTVGHGGSMRGFFSALSIVPEHNMGIFVVANRAPESGGGAVPIGFILATVIGNLPGVPVRENFVVPKRVRERVPGEYVGKYCYGVFCHECSPEEIAAGAWPPGPSQTVTEKEGALIISDREYLPIGEDVFVRRDGQKMVYFGRDNEGQIAFFVYSSSVDTFERSSR